MNRAYYQNSAATFLKQESVSILGELARNNQFSLDDLQRNTWIAEIDILKQQLSEFKSGYILFEYSIPRVGKRIDNVFIYQGIIFVIEFKVGEKNYPNYAIDQVEDYALDLKNFHKESHDKLIVPILVCTEAQSRSNQLTVAADKLSEVLMCNANNIGETIKFVCGQIDEPNIDPYEWINSIYMPTPTIIEAAQALYRGHDVREISRSDAGALNLNRTTEAINKIIDESKAKKEKSICFITGVPGAGKTLAGLNIANRRHKFDEDEHAVFLSGNQPLVDVLREALARDEVEREKTTKKAALQKARAFIQNIHHFRDDSLSIDRAPTEKVVIFDESQRAWDEEMLADFMKQKKGQPNFNMSEPEFLIGVMDRHQDWCVIICLVGGGQEINKGEAGISEWFDALRDKYLRWTVYVSDRLHDKEYVGNSTIADMLCDLKYKANPDLHLAVSLRSFRSENVSAFVKYLLDADIEKARALYSELIDDYPIYVTRNLETAKAWVKGKARGTERYGLVASSGAKRLRSQGIWVQSKIDPKNWFLNGKNDTRSSFALEETATEFDIQGLELDWTIVCWDANLRYENSDFEYYAYKGSKWQRVNKKENRAYLKNAYRVLLTRARQGFIIFLPYGDDEDYSRRSNFYNGINSLMVNIGIKNI